MTRSSGSPAGDFLGTGARWVGLAFPGIDAPGTIDPLGLVHGVEPTVDLGIAPPFDSHQEALLIVW